MSTDIALIQKDNVAAIAQQAPIAFANNQLSHDRCLAYGQTLLDTIEGNGGLNDELDAKAAEYVKKSRNTVTKMNNERSSVTKLFDEIRGVFTSMENDVDPTKQGTIPYRLQTMRNEYAQKKHEEAERKRREVERIQRIEQAKIEYRGNCEEAYKKALYNKINYVIRELTELNMGITLQTFEADSKRLKEYAVDMTEKQFDGICSVPAFVPSAITNEEANVIRESVMAELRPKFFDQYRFELESNRDALLDMLPSKKMELERIAHEGQLQAMEHEQAMKKREAEEAARLQAERKEKERKEQQEAELKRQQAEMGSLFAASAVAMPTYQPKTSVKKKIEIRDKRAIFDILNFWWMNEGMDLSIDDLKKKFKAQITYAEKMANAKDAEFIKSDYLEYIDEVKAK